MSQYHNVVLIGGPADGRRLSVLHGVSTVRVCEMPGIDYSHLSDRRPDLTRDALRTFEYEICWGAGNWKVACLRGNDSQGVLDALIQGYRAEVQR